MAEPDVWVAKEDGSNVIRAAAIAAVGRDYNGNVTARLSGGEQSVVTLVTDDEHVGNTPADFHVQLLRIVARLADTAEPAIIRPVRDEQEGWRWVTGRL
jgi:hypothetical protein